MSSSLVRNERTGPTCSASVGVEHRGQPGDAALGEHLEHDVGLVEPGLRAGVERGRCRRR